MKPLRIILLVLTLSALLSIGVCAEHLPENNIIGQELIVEKDSNIVKDNIQADKNPEYEPKYDVIKVTKAEYFKLFTRPAIILLLSALAVFGVVSWFEYRKKR